jgi:hypothetical protein
MASNGEIRLEGLDSVLRGLARADKQTADAALRGVKEAGARIIASAQRNLKANTSWVTGLLGNSGRVEEVKEQDGSRVVDIGFFAKGTKQGYAEYVEYGRPPGKMPPPSALEEWFYKKHRVTDRRKARAYGWGLAVNISTRGTKPHPFFNPAVEEHRLKILEALNNAIAKVTGKPTI